MDGVVVAVGVGVAVVVVVVVVVGVGVEAAVGVAAAAPISTRVGFGNVVRANSLVHAYVFIAVGVSGCDIRVDVAAAVVGGTVDTLIGVGVEETMLASS